MACTVAVAFVGVCVQIRSINAADPTFVGSLAIAVEDEAASELQLPAVLCPAMCVDLRAQRTERLLTSRERGWRILPA